MRLSFISVLLAALAYGQTTANFDQGRTGANLLETRLTTSNVTSGKFGKLGAWSVNGEVIFAQPLKVNGITGFSIQAGTELGRPVQAAYHGIGSRL